MADQWTQTTFDNFIKLNRGFDLPNRMIQKGEYPVVASTSVKAWHRESKVAGPGVVTGRSGSLGAVQYIETDFWPLNTTLYVKDFKGNDPRFVYYFLQTMHLENFNAGAGVPSLNQNHLHKLPVRIPNLELQRKIAAVLSAYDALIANNTKRIEVQKKLAKQLYREWFVRIRAPGVGKGKSARDLPTGWRSLTLGDACKVARGSSPRPKNDSRFFANGNIPWTKIADATASNMYIYETRETINEFGATFSRHLPAGSLIIATSGTLGFSIFLGVEACVHDGWIYLQDYKHNLKPVFVYYLINSLTDHLNNLAYGAAIQNVNTDIIRQLPLTLPTEEVLQQFYDLVEPMHASIQLLAKSNILLIKQRNSLHGRLVSGQLPVADAEIAFHSASGLAEIKDEPELVHA